MLISPAFKTLYKGEKRYIVGGRKRFTLQVHTAGGGKGHTLDVHTAGGKGYTLDVQTAGC
jgi:hypothetical protein